MMAFLEFRSYGWDLSNIMDEILEQKSANHVKVKEMFWPKEVVEHEALEEKEDETSITPAYVRKNRSEFLRDMLEFKFISKDEEFKVLFLDPNTHKIPGQKDEEEEK